MVEVIQQGGVGNCCFQIAAAYCYSLKYGMDYLVSDENINPHLGQKSILFPNVKYGTLSKEIPEYVEPAFHYNQIPYMPNLRMVGYFQSHLYHYEYKSELIKLFNIPSNPLRGKIFIHKRLGDYKHLGKFHKIISDEYIQKSIEYFESIGFNKFLVLSDEVAEARQSINSHKYFGCKFEYAEGNTELEDLSLMASCEGGIMSASSFSWWGAYLGTNENRIILYPENWFGESLSNHSIKNLCPENWVAL